MKKMLPRYCAGHYLLQDVLNRRLLFKQTGSSSTKGNHHPSFLRFWNWSEAVDAAKICGGAENVVKANPANIRKWIARFYYFDIYTPLEARWHVCSQ